MLVKYKIIALLINCSLYCHCFHLSYLFQGKIIYEKYFCIFLVFGAKKNNRQQKKKKNQFGWKASLIYINVFVRLFVCFFIFYNHKPFSKFEPLILKLPKLHRDISPGLYLDTIVTWLGFHWDIARLYLDNTRTRPRLC